MLEKTSENRIIRYDEKVKMSDFKNHRKFMTAKKRRFTPFLIGFCLIILGITLLSAPFGIAQESLTPTPTANGEIPRIGLYEKFEISFAVPGDYNNPYDPDQIDVSATFSPPSGTPIRVPAFYIQPYAQTCEQDCTAEVLETSGEGTWQVRFAPHQVGIWRYRVRASFGDQQTTLREGRFEAVTSERRGFIRVAPNGRYFAFDDGSSYFPVGQNLGWSWEGGGGIFTFLAWMDKLAASGANYARIYIDVPWFIGLEWESPPGQYNNEGQKAAWRLDRIVEAAEERDIYLQLVLIWHQSFQFYTGAPVVIPREPRRPNQDADFDNTPYNAQLGGLLQNPGAIFLDSFSQGLLARRLRYIAARWGYSSHIMAWEVVDSLDQMDNFEPARAVEWLNSLISVIRENDPFTHLITAGTQQFQPEFIASAALDFTQSRLYQTRPIESAQDQVTRTIETTNQTHAAAENRPTLLSEFSLNPWFEPTTDDPTGVHIRNTIWAAVFSGAAGSAMSWWWDTYIDPQALYSIYTPLALYTRDLDWNSLDLRPTDVSLIAEEAITYTPLRIEDFNRRFLVSAPENVVYRVTADGTMPPTTQMSSYLYGKRYNADNSRAQTFIITPPVPTTLALNIVAVSTAANARLEVQLDGTPISSLDLTAGTRDLTVNVPLPAGRHTVIIDNLGDDWLELGYIEIADYRSPMRAMALTDSSAGVALVWLHHRTYNWEDVQSNTPRPALNFRLEIPEMPAGTYRIEFWDTLTGNVIGEDFVMVAPDSGNVLPITLLPVTEQLAIRAFRIDPA